MWNASAIGVDADHGQLTTGDLDDFIRLKTMCFDSNTDLDRRGSGSDGFGVQADPIAHEYRLLEFNTLEGDGHPSVASMLSCLIETSLVNERQDDTTEDRSQRVRITGHHLYAKSEIL